MRFSAINFVKVMLSKYEINFQKIECVFDGNKIQENLLLTITSKLKGILQKENQIQFHDSVQFIYIQDNTTATQNQQLYLQKVLNFSQFLLFFNHVC